MNGCTHILNQWSAAGWEYALHATWQAALTTAILLGVAALGRKWPAPWRYGVLLVALLKFAIPPFLPVPSGAFSQLGPRVAASAPVTPGNQPSIGSASDSHFARAISGEADSRLDVKRPPDSSVFAAQPASAHPGMVVAKGAGLEWTPWLMLLHLAGCAAMFFWIARQLGRLRGAVRASRPVAAGPLHLFLNSLAAELRMKRIPALRISDRVAAPVAFGVLHPTILMPATTLSRFSERELKVILAHELAHFRRGDLWVNWAQLLLQAIWWFNPLLWILNTALRKTREDCCDDLLLARKVTSGEHYCDTLLRAAVEFGGPEPLTGALGIGERLHPLGRRFARIMDAGMPRACRLSVWGIILLLGMGLLLLPGLRSQTASDTQRATSSNPTPVSATVVHPTGSMPASASATIPGPLERLFAELKLDRLRHDRAQERLRLEFKGYGQKAVAFLANELASAASSDQRQKAAWLLSQMDSPVPPHAIQALTRALEDEDKEVARGAAMSLRDIGPAASEAVPALMAALKRRNTAAGLALARIAPDSEQVARLLVESFEEACKLASTEWPETLEHSTAEGLAGQLIFAFMEMNTNRLEMERALVSAYRPAAAQLQGNIIFALKNLKPQTPEGRETVRAYLAAEQKKWGAHYSLPKGGVQELIATIQAPAGQSDIVDSVNRLMAGAARHDTNVAQAVPVLIEIARNPVRRYRAYAVSALGTIGLAASNTVPCILSCLDDHDQTVRSVAIETLGQIGPPAKSAVPAIRKLLQDQNDSIRRVAADALWRIDSEYVPLALSIFIEMLNQRSLRGDAPAYSLDQMGPRAKQALPTLARLLDDPDPLVRLAAAKAFWHIDPSQIARALPALGSLTEEPDFARVEAIMLLGEIGPAAKAALPRIQACLNDEDVEIHRAAVQAVCSISVGATPTPAPSPGSPPRVP